MPTPIRQGMDAIPRRMVLGGLAGLSAAGMGLAPAWAATGAAYLTAANTPANATFLLGLSEGGQIAFQIPIPARGHAAAAHPSRAEAVAFARRPGNFARVINCPDGRVLAELTTPPGRHFYGHGAFTADGAALLTTENDYETGEGRIGIWDGQSYARIDELPSGGIGPHEIIRLPSGGFALANGGIRTHPDRGRAKLNLPQMQTNLSWLTADGRIAAQAHAPMRQNSIRHIAADAEGRVVAALQWQGPPHQLVPLAALIAGEKITYLEHPETARLKHYAGSVALSADGGRIALTGPKGGRVLFFEGQSGAAQGGADLPEVSGAAQLGARGFALTSRRGLVRAIPDRMEIRPTPGDWHFDNHLVRI